MMRKLGSAAAVLFVILLCFMLWKETDLFRGRQTQSGFWSKWVNARQQDQGSEKRNPKSSFIPSRLQMDDNILSMDVCDKVETVIMFIGYPRSGHSLIGSLIDAHQHAIVANEFDMVGSWKAWDLRQQNKYYLFSQLYKNSQKQIMGGYRTSNARHLFDYAVPNQWQGKFKDMVKVIGDKKGGKTTRQLTKQKRLILLSQIQQAIGIPIKYLHVIRNPFDNISTMLLRTLKIRAKVSNQRKRVNNPKALEWEIKKYFDLANMNNVLRKRFANRVLDIHYIDIVSKPRDSLSRICKFLKLSCDDQFLKDCTGIIYAEPSTTRNYVVWTEDQKKMVQKQIDQFSFLKNYTFSSYL